MFDELFQILLSHLDALHAATFIALWRLYRDKEKCQDGRLKDAKHASAVIDMSHKQISELPDGG